MRHVSLYRKWRPRTFDAVAGQEPVVRTLRRAVESGRVAHAYLFSGPRGTGKTSTAKVLAMGLNCARGPTAVPDGTCESCRAIVNNSSIDVLEMDAASNRGIDEIRDLRDKVNLAPAAARTKVYIIDEVHMLTTEAFNALLKMLEEPPEHVVFVLATTEKHRVPATIVSRCQSFDFRRPSVTLLSEKLREIADAEGIEAEPEALTILAREGRGSFRDAEGLLDQLASFADGPVTAREVRELLGSVDSDVLLEATDALAERRAADALRILDQLSNEGKDLSQFAGELVSHLRRLMLLPDVPEVALADVGAEERAGLEEQASRVVTAEAVRMISALGEALSRMRRGGDAKLELELTFLKLVRGYEEPSVERLFERLEALESAVANGAVPAVSRTTAEHSRAQTEVARETIEAGARATSGQEAEVDEDVASPVGAEKVWEADEHAPSEAEAGEAVTRAPAASPESEDQEPGAANSAGDGGQESPQEDLAASLRGQWDLVDQELKRRKKALTAAYLKEGQAWPVAYADGVLTVSFAQEQDFYIREIDKPQHREALTEVLEEQFGIRPRLEFRISNGEPGSVNAAPAHTDSPARPDDSGIGRSVSKPEEATRLEPPEQRYATEEKTGLATPESGSRIEAGTPHEVAPEAEDEPDGAGVEGADGTIGNPQEALEMAWELFGSPDGRSSGGDQNGGV